MAELSNEQKRVIRRLFFEDGISVDNIASRSRLTHDEVQAILGDPDPLADFELYHFGELTRKLHEQARKVIDSLTESDLENAPVSSRSTLLKTSLDTMQKTHDLHMIHKDKSEDFKLARLLAMGREEAREALVERFKSLAHILFGGMSEDELVTLMRSMNGELPEGDTALTLVEGGGGEDGHDGNGGADTGRRNGAPQGVGAFRGIKEGKPA